ncbi:MAG: 4'-phosphopantetheinyl transferase superfamily protein [Rhodanobacteraceae bacterium]
MRGSIADGTGLDADTIHLHWLDWHLGVQREPLRRILAPYLGTRPQSVGFIQDDASSKPRLAGESAGLCFNWSHSGEWALAAVARDVELGVDLECRQRKVNALGLAERFFSAGEFRYLQDLPPQSRASAFMRLWTGKEAVLKTLGLGISGGLDRVVLSLSPRQDLRIDQLALSNLHEQDLRLQSLPVPRQNAFAALAWVGGPRRIVHFRNGELLAESALTAPEAQELLS